MDLPLLVLLALATFALVIGVVLWSKRATERRMDNDAAPKSTLAKDADSHGKPADF